MKNRPILGAFSSRITVKLRNSKSSRIDKLPHRLLLAVLAKSEPNSDSRRVLEGILIEGLKNVGEQK